LSWITWPRGAWRVDCPVFADILRLGSLGMVS
jgi:hypothetical protein